MNAIMNLYPTDAHTTHTPHTHHTPHTTHTHTHHTHTGAVSRLQTQGNVFSATPRGDNDALFGLLGYSMVAGRFTDVNRLGKCAAQQC